MAVKETLKMGHPLLQQIAKPVAHFNTPELDALIQDMLDTMAALNGAGLAAPQIGVSLRVIIFGVEANPRYPEIEAVPLTVLINPEITEWEGYSVGREGCLSVPDYTGNVIRAERVTVEALDERGQAQCYRMEGFEARVAQHEIDHLDGLLFLDRLVSRRNDLFRRQAAPARLGK